MLKRLLFFLLCITMHITAQEVSEEDKNALIALYNATDGDNWSSSWNLTDPPQFWFGVKTTNALINGEERLLVTGLDLSFRRLSGNIPSELGNLKDLKSLNLSNNSLSGAVPTELGNLTLLETLELERNQLEGEIPSTLFSQHETLYSNINLSFNKLSGTLPLSLGTTVDFDGTIDVSHNQLTALANYSGSDFSGIQTLNINNNLLPFATLEQENNGNRLINTLDINVANLSFSPQNNIGTVENIVFSEGATLTLTLPNLASTNNTYQWYKDGTIIDGAINTTYQIANTTTNDIGIYYCEVKNSVITELTLTRNPITVDNEATINDKNALIALYNATSGPNWSSPWDLTTEMGNWKGVITDSNGRVIELDCTDFGLAGTLPEEIWTLTDTEKLIFNRNRGLSGSILTNVTNLTKLKALEFRETSVGGTILPELFGMLTLESLAFSEKFTGSLAGIENLVNLREIVSNGSDITEVPESLWTLTGLEEIDITSTDEPLVNISMPSSMSPFTALKKLRLWGNQTQPIPTDLTTLTNLEILSLRGFDTEPIPQNIDNLINLTELDLSDGFTGTIPSEIGNLTNLVDLSMHSNQLSGGIPEEIGNLSSLRGLNISDSNLEGAIPATIGNLSNLFIAFLDFNNLSGEIPSSIAELPNLNFFGIALNKFIFEDLEQNIDAVRAIPSSLFQIQQNIDEEANITIEEGIEITLSVDATQSPNNMYQWYKDGEIIDGATERNLTITNAGADDIGVYNCFVTNSIVTGMTLRKNNITLSVTLSTEAFASAGITTYPIPAQEQLTIALGDLSGLQVNATIYDLLGNQVLTQAGIQNNETIDITTLASGSYILQLEESGKTYASMILKQ